MLAAPHSSFRTIIVSNDDAEALVGERVCVFDRRSS